jgi:hypothetical protein
MNHLLSKHQPAMSSISFWYNYTSYPNEELIPGSERSVSILEHLRDPRLDQWLDRSVSLQVFSTGITFI